MAVTYKTTTNGGRRHTVYTINETAVAAATEVELLADFPIGQITHLEAQLTGGSGTTLDPRAGRVTAFAASSLDQIFVWGTPAAYINDGTVVKYASLTDGRIYLNFGVDSGSDNVVAARVTVIEGQQA